MKRFGNIQRKLICKTDFIVKELYCYIVAHLFCFTMLIFTLEYGVFRARCV